MGYKHKYTKIYNDDDYSSDISMNNLAKQGSKSIKGLIHKDVVVKKRRYK